MSGLTTLLILAYFGLIAMLVAIWLSVPGGSGPGMPRRGTSGPQHPSASSPRRDTRTTPRRPTQRNAPAMDDPFEQFLKESERRRNR